MPEAAECALTKMRRQGWRAGEVEPQLDAGVGGVYSLASGTGRARKPLEQLCRWDDQLPRDMQVVGHTSSMPHAEKENGASKGTFLPHLHGTFPCWR
jgi:hypothetical protein